MGIGMIIIGLLLVAIAGLLFFVAVSIMEEKGDDYEKEAFEKEQEEISKEVMEMMRELGGDEEE